MLVKGRHKTSLDNMFSRSPHNTCAYQNTDNCYDKQRKMQVENQSTDQGTDHHGQCLE